MKRNMFLLFSVILAMQSISGQNISIDNVQKVTLRNADAIKEGSEVKGYFFFYISDKIDRNTNEYTLRILDNNLNKLKDIKFQDSKNVSIIEASFNGTDLVFLFYDSDEKTLQYDIYGADGKRKHSYTRQLTNKDLQFLELNLSKNTGDESYKGLFPIEGKGFVSIMPSREDKDFTFQLDYFSSNKRKQWNYIPKDGGKISGCMYMGTFNGVIYTLVFRYSSLFDKDPTTAIVGLDLETGKKVSEKSTNGKNRFLPISMSALNEKKAYLFGEYYDNDAILTKSKSKGLSFWEINEKGEISNEKYLSWDQDISKFLNVNSKGKVDELGYVYMHNMVETPDGNIYVIGEGFKVGGLVWSKATITDLVIFTFDKSLNLKETKVYDKNENIVGISGLVSNASGTVVGGQIKFVAGGFDYAYTQMSKDHSYFSVCYSDYVRDKDYKGATFNSITYNDGQFTTDKIKAKSDATNSVILPAKNGQVLIVDYYKKQKRLDVHLEKLN